MTEKLTTGILRAVGACSSSSAADPPATPVPAWTEAVIIGSAPSAVTGKGQAVCRGRGRPKTFSRVQTLTSTGPCALIRDEGQNAKEHTATWSQAIEQLAAPVIADGLVLRLSDGVADSRHTIVTDVAWHLVQQRLSLRRTRA